MREQGLAADVITQFGFDVDRQEVRPVDHEPDEHRGYCPERHGQLKLHFYTFGGLQVTSDWITEFRKGTGDTPRPLEGQR